MTIPFIPTPVSPVVRFFKNDFVVAAIIAVALSGLTFALAYSLGWLTEAPNWFEVAGATINYGATYLSIKQRRLTYILGFTASAAFAVAYFQYGLLASALLSAYLVGQLVYGYFRWGPDGKTRPVHKFKWGNWWMYALATVLTYAGAVALVTVLGGQFAFWDASILILTILAQFLLDNKVLAAWFVWGAVNVVGVTLYFTAGAPFAAMQQLIFLFANIPGFILWKRSMDAAKPVFVHNTDFDPGFLQKYSEADVKATQAIFDAMPGTGRITKDEGLKSLYTGDSKVAATFHPNFQPSETIIMQTGNMPKINDESEPTWRRLVDRDADRGQSSGHAAEEDDK